MFVGAVSDTIDQPIKQKIFHARIIVDNEQVKRETEAYVPIPEISSFRDADGIDHMEEIIQQNYNRVKADVVQIVKRELKRIEADPNLAKLLPPKKK